MCLSQLTNVSILGLITPLNLRQTSDSDHSSFDQGSLWVTGDLGPPYCFKNMHLVRGWPSSLSHAFPLKRIMTLTLYWTIFRRFCWHFWLLRLSYIIEPYFENHFWHLRLRHMRWILHVIFWHARLRHVRWNISIIFTRTLRKVKAYSLTVYWEHRRCLRCSTYSSVNRSLD